MSKRDYSAREAGDTIFIGYAITQTGDVLRKIYGPVTICSTELNVSQAKGQEPVVKMTYRINSLDSTFNDRVCFDSLDAAYENANQEYAKLVESKK